MRLACTVAVAALLAACGDGADHGFIPPGSEPRIVVDPALVTFRVVALVEAPDAIVTIHNEGAADLAIVDVFLRGDDVSVFQVDVDIDQPYAGEHLVLPPGASLELRVVYRPERLSAPASAELCFESNDPRDPTLCIPLASDGCPPRLEVSPDPIDFGTVPAGEEAALDVTVTNVGCAPLEFATHDDSRDGVYESTGIALTGSPDFAPDRGTREAVLFDSIHDGLEPGESTSITLGYRPPTQSSDEGELVVSVRYGNEVRTGAYEIHGNTGAP